MSLNDPIGCAILDYANQNDPLDHITVEADLCDDDVIPVPYLFRTFDEMPEVERLALQNCSGKILDIGAGTGCHTLWLQERGFDVTALEKSPGACNYMRSKELKVLEENLWDLKEAQYDTILVLMNGVGLSGTLDRLPTFLNHLKSLLHPDGKILMDSSDIRYLYQEEDGSYWVDLNAHYFGEMQFKMRYKKHETEWFQWVYVDPEKLEENATKCGLNYKQIATEDDHFLVELTINQ